MFSVQRAGLLFAGYFVLAQLAMWLAFPPVYAAPVWPATGLALYCLLVWGMRYWPVVWLAAFTADLFQKTVIAGLPLNEGWLALTAVTAVGSMLEVVIIAGFLARLSTDQKGISSEKRVLQALLLVTPLAGTLSATIGVGCLHLLQEVPAGTLAGSWLIWWMAECLGVLMFAPFILQRKLRAPWEKKNHIGKLQLLPLLLIVLVVIAFHSLSRLEKAQFQQRFAAVGELLHEHLESGLVMIERMMVGTSAFMTSSAEVTPTEFRHFARHSLQAQGIEGVAWVPRVSYEQRKRFEAEAGHLVQGPVFIREHNGQGRLMPATVRDHYYPLQLGAFRPGHAFAAGYDLGSEYPERLQAVIRQGRPVLLERHVLYGVSAGSTDGWRYFLPVYEPGLDVLRASEQQREASFLGFVVGVLYFDELMHTLRRNLEALGVSFCIRLEATDQSPAEILVDTRQQTHQKRSPDWVNHPEFLADRMMTVKGWATSPWQPAQSVFMGLFVIASVLLLCLMTAYVILAANQNTRFARRVRSRTQALKKARQKTADILNNMASYVIELDRRQHIVNVNRAMLTAYGQPRSELLGQPFTHIAWLLDMPRETAAFQRNFEKALVGERTRHDVRLRHPGGGFFFVDMNMIPIRDGQGGISRVIISAINITERKVAEGQLEQAREDAEQANRAKSHFLATMSHEIRTPLNGVIGMLDVLAGTELTRRQQDMLELVHYSATSLTELMSSILEFSKIESGKIEIEQAPLAMTELVERTCLMLDQQARELGVELLLFVDPALPEQVVGDSLRLRQILNNLVSNAVKFSSTRQPGKVSVRASLIDERRSAITVRFEVADNGIGMDESVQTRLFQAFTQGDSSMSRRFGGTGLGLSITHRLVTLLGGDIKVQSEPDQGSCFTISLPFELETDYAASDRCDERLADLSCLVIGGNDGIASDLLCYLRHEQTRVHYAPTLAAATQMSALYPAGDCIWVYDATRQRFPVSELREAAALWPEHKVCFVTLERGARRQARRMAGDHVMIDANVLKRKAFIEAIAGAAGHITLPDRRYAMEKLPTPGAVLPQQRSKTRILVAEDNVVNQKVIQEQLALLGYTADIAGNGREALERWRSGTYDILLTDLSMPGMDGYELARQIREEERGASSMPIIALSANAFREEMASCTEQGMSDYLTKPVMLDSLRRMLDHWLPASQPALSTLPAGEPNTGVADPQPHSVLDIKVLQALVGDDEQLCHELLNDYRQQLENHLPEFYQASHRRDLGRLADIAHVLKSASRSVGALVLGDLCEQIEASCSENTSMPSSDVIARFGLTCQEVIESINEINKGRYECETQRR